jgi:hypothetical protein
MKIDPEQMEELKHKIFLNNPFINTQKRPNKYSINHNKVFIFQPCSEMFKLEISELYLTPNISEYYIGISKRLGENSREYRTWCTTFFFSIIRTKLNKTEN